MSSAIMSTLQLRRSHKTQIAIEYDKIYRSQYLTYTDKSWNGRDKLCQTAQNEICAFN